MRRRAGARAGAPPGAARAAGAGLRGGRCAGSLGRQGKAAPARDKCSGAPRRGCPGCARGWRGPRGRRGGGAKWCSACRRGAKRELSLTRVETAGGAGRRALGGRHHIRSGRAAAAQGVGRWRRSNSRRWLGRGVGAARGLEGAWARCRTERWGAGQSGLVAWQAGQGPRIHQAERGPGPGARAGVLRGAKARRRAAARASRFGGAAAGRRRGGRAGRQGAARQARGRAGARAAPSVRAAVHLSSSAAVRGPPRVCAHGRRAAGAGEGASLPAAVAAGGSARGGAGYWL
jgi:hypothetical protein